MESSFSQGPFRITYNRTPYPNPLAGNRVTASFCCVIIVKLAVSVELHRTRRI